MKHTQHSDANNFTPRLSARPPLLDQIAAGERNVLELAGGNHWSLTELATWMSHPGNRAILSQLAALEDARAQMLISRYRATAAMQLAAIACSQEPGETARKACVDLLNVGLAIDAGDLPAAGERSSRAARSAGNAAGLSSQEILRTLEVIGSEASAS